MKVLIIKLNPVIRGWVNDYSNVVSKDTYHKLDILLWKRLWRWASRRHPNKSATWVKKKYFPNIKGTKNWILNKGEYMLNRHSDVSVMGHIKVKGINHSMTISGLTGVIELVKFPGVRKKVAKLLKSQKNT